MTDGVRQRIIGSVYKATAHYSAVAPDYYIEAIAQQAARTALEVAKEQIEACTHAKHVAVLMLDTLLADLSLRGEIEEEKNDYGAALLPVDPSAAVQTEALPHDEDYAAVGDCSCAQCASSVEPRPNKDGNG